MLLTHRSFKFTLGRPAIRIFLAFIKALEADFSEDDALFQIEITVDRRKGAFSKMPKAS